MAGSTSLMLSAVVPSGPTFTLLQNTWISVSGPPLMPASFPRGSKSARRVLFRLSDAAVTSLSTGPAIRRLDHRGAALERRPHRQLHPQRGQHFRQLQDLHGGAGKRHVDREGVALRRVRAGEPGDGPADMYVSLIHRARAFLQVVRHPEIRRQNAFGGRPLAGVSTCRSSAAVIFVLIRLTNRSIIIRLLQISSAGGGSSDILYAPVRGLGRSPCRAHIG